MGDIGHLIFANAPFEVPSILGIDVSQMLREARAPIKNPDRIEDVRRELVGLAMLREFASSYLQEERKDGPPRRRGTKSNNRRHPRDRFEDARDELCRSAPAYLAEMRAAVNLGGEATAIAEVERLVCEAETLLTKAEVFAASIPRIGKGSFDPVKVQPWTIWHLFNLYQQICGPSGMSAEGPAVRFIGIAIKSVGWGTKTGRAIEDALRREQRLHETIQNA